MTLKEFLSLIQDEEVRIEVEVDDGIADYHYLSFWLSDYRSNLDVVKHYKDSFVEGICFSTREDESEITICVKI